MDIGVFIPIGNNGWLISTSSPQYMPTFELNKQVVQKAEHYGFDFALSMIKLRGFGGKSEFWDHDLESFTLMAGLAAVTRRIQLYASVAVLTIPPAIVARMASTIDSISGGRFGVNIVSGWAKAEYEPDGAVAGRRRISTSATTTAPSTSRIMQRALGDRHVQLQGRVLPDGGLQALAAPAGLREDRLRRPERPRGIEFGASYGDYNFVRGQGRQHADGAFGHQRSPWPKPRPKPAATSATTCCSW